MLALASPRSFSWSSLVMRALALVTALVTPVTGLGAWLLLADPAVAADVAASGDLWPLVEAVVDVLSTALRRSIEFL